MNTDIDGVKKWVTERMAKDIHVSDKFVTAFSRVIIKFGFNDKICLKIPTKSMINTQTLQKCH